LLEATGLEQPLKARVSPGSILVILVGGIVLAEIIAMIAVFFIRDRPYVQQVALDAAIMAAIIFPLLYYLSFRPLLLRIEQQQQAKTILQARLRLMQYANFHTQDELQQYSLDAIEALAGSANGAIYLLEADE
jgi:hypothetical protein